MVNGNAIF